MTQFVHADWSFLIALAFPFVYTSSLGVAFAQLQRWKTQLQKKKISCAMPDQSTQSPQEAYGCVCVKIGDTPFTFCFWSFKPSHIGTHVLQNATCVFGSKHVLQNYCRTVYLATINVWLAFILTNEYRDVQACKHAVPTSAVSEWATVCQIVVSCKCVTVAEVMFSMTIHDFYL